jgi:photosystem II stability/assembly factor-like uncharacterized protein
MRSLLVIAFTAVIVAPLAATPAPHDDAALRAVQFVDAKEGWVVGDQGTIWHTIDGGKTWERQSSGSKASLRGLCFLTPYQGYVVGRTELPNRVGSTGVILVTEDGGATWKELTSSTLPGLQVVKFFDDKNGLVAGESTDLFPSGVYFTENAGQSWKPVEEGLNQHQAWSRFVEGDLKNFVLEAAPEEFGQFQNGELNCIIRDAIATKSAKESWKPSPLPPGGLLRSSFFINEKLGWAVGELGNIQHTYDGGKTWQMQKSGGNRTAVLSIHTRSENVPLPLFGLLSGKEGYQSAAVSFHSKDEARLSSAMRMVGGSFARTLPMPSALRAHYMHEPLPKGSPALLKLATDDATLRELTKLIQELKPEVIICDSGMTLAEQWVNNHLLEAVKLAAESHQVKKIYAVTEGEVQLDLTTFHPELGDCLLDFSEPARHLFSYETVSSRMSFKLISSTMAGAEQHRNIMQGIELAPGGSARRKKVESSPAIVANLPTREEVCKARRALEALFAEPMTRERVEPSLVKCLEQLQKLPEYSVPTVAVDLGFRFAQAGQWTAARELFAGVAEHHAVHPDAVEAMRWLVKYQSSGEVRRRLERGDFPIFQKAAFTPVEANPIRTVSTLDEVLPKPSLKFINSEAMRQWHQASLDLQPKLAAFGAVYSQDVETLLPMIVARRNLGLHARALGLLQQIAHQPNTYNDVKARLITERNILDNKPTDVPLKVNPAQMPYCGTPELTSTFTKTKPVLDGALDEECWKVANSFELPTSSTTTKAYRTRTMLTHDDKFLYVALMCEHPEGQATEKVARKGYDADLKGHDRVEFVLDQDRDYTTAYRFCIDHRGLVAEDCWGDSTWNPKWFVAQQATPKGWVVELAIPFSELSDTAPSSGTRWGMNLVRVIPGVGQESWGGDWSGRPTAGNMGLLQFKK